MWRRRAKHPYPAEVAEALADLERLAVERPELSAASRELSRVIVAAFADVPRSEQPLTPPPGISRGDPLLAVLTPRLSIRRLLGRTRAILRASPGGARVDSRLARVLRKHPEVFADWCGAILDGRFSEPVERLEVLGLESDRILTALRLAILAELSTFSAGFGPWSESPRCPVCGSDPLLVESRGLLGERWFRCGLCAAQWPGRRTVCAACGETDPNRLGRLAVEGEESRRHLAVCETCGRRLVVVSTLGPLSPPGLLVSELATIPLRLLSDLRTRGIDERLPSDPRPSDPITEAPGSESP